ncbi:UDP-N-acetylhexosamine pyrophosphorylase-like Protein [Tribolium castaneum]|uniref:UDP-N-acetylglucosamine diphosphorylase n=1 Tax=Tribolium castaneum TaxID=7070 RepID=D6W8B1_TRICA|nr:UDP-N-acetylhexosamine pyrophosphorylase-like Protein [Tribolium castaneum]
MSEIDEIRAKLRDQKHEHLLRYWPELNNEEKKHLLEQLKSIDIEKINDLFRRAESSYKETQRTYLDDQMKPLDPSHFESEETSTEETLNKYRTFGLEEIAAGRVAVLLLAGGQGTRLGVSYPKGMYNVGLPSGKTLFQLQAERIRRLQTLAKGKTGKSGKIPWYIMTSGPTDEATEKFLQQNNYFGLDKTDVVLFKQGLLPCFDFEGRAFLDGKANIARAPDGNGGIYRALAQNKILDDMQQRGVKYVHVHSVDNILVKVADPVFVGYCKSKEADCAAKVVQKTNPDEAVGVVCFVDGQVRVVEYSEITPSTASLTDKNDRLVFNAGNICNHLFTVDFLKEVADKYEDKLKLHVAKKKIPYLDDEGNLVKPAQVSGVKIEKFVFDVFPFSKKFVAWEVPRNSEFSAMKNADKDKKDCPSTAKSDLLALHKRYIEKAGGVVRCDEVEISPLLSYEGENLEQVRGKVFEKPIILAPDEELTCS